MTSDLLTRVRRIPFWMRAAAISFVLVVPFVPAIAPSTESMLLTNRYNPGMGLIRSASDLVYQAILFGVLLYMLLGISFIRRREASAAARLSPLIDDPVEVLREAFWPARWLTPPVAASVLFLGVYMAGDIDGIGHLDAWSLGPFLADMALVFCRFVIAYSFVWTYCASIVGLARVCRRPLRLQPYYRDRLLGTRPLGQLSLTLAATFLVGLALAGLWVVTGSGSVSLFVFMAALAVVGVGLFFLPLQAVHVQMRWHKSALAAASADRYRELFLHDDRPGATDAPSATLEEVRDVVAFEVIERRIAGIRTWPFDTQILVRLGTSFALPIVLAVLTRQAVLVVLGI